MAAHAAEPTRQELWVPTKNLDTVLKAHPNAVMLSPEQYEALIRDAGKVKPEDDPKTAPPKLIAIEGLRLSGKVEPNAASVRLQGELTLNLPSKEWLSTKIAWPLAMSNVTSEGNVLAYVEKDAKQRELIVFAKGPGSAKLRFEADVPVFLRTRLGEHTLEMPDVPFGGVLNLELPAGVRLLAGSACEQTGNALKVAFDHRAFEDYESNLQPGTPRAFRVRWIDSSPQAAAQPWRCSETAQATISVTESEVVSILVFGVRAEGDTANEFEAEWKLTGKDAQVADVEGAAVRRWRQDGGKLFVTLERDGRMQNIVVSLRRTITSAVEAGELPLLALNPPLHAGASLNLAPDIELLDVVNVKQAVHHPGEDIAKMLNLFEFQLGVDQPKLVLRTSKPRLESDVDVVARIDKDSVQIERRIMLRSDRPASEIKLTLPTGEEFNALLSKPVGSDQMMITLNSAQPQKQLITPNIVSQPVFSQSAVTPNSGTAVTAGSQFRLTWRRVGQTIAILPAQPLSPTNALEFSITSRLKLAKAWKGPRTPESVTIEHLQIPEAVKVAGYTALDFDDAWRVALKEAKGLEDRDARLTPVKGRMAWFGLREHSLTFEVERAEAVFSTEVTAYALPRARTIEIEGQFALDISGAPLRSFQVKLPVENAKLLRVTSPLVGEQQLDEATGVWTFTLRQESKGQQNVRWRMSLPAASSEATPEDADKSVRAPITATLPRLELPQSRRFAGTWVIEANTDTQLSTKMQNMQPLDVLRVPVVAGYQPRHRITSAFTFGAGENALTITAQRHAHSELAALVVNRMSLISVLGTDGHSLHEARLDLSHSGEQFVSLHLPQDAELLSTSSGGQAVKPVRSVEDAIAIPLPAGSANAPHTEVRVQFRQNGSPWNRSGTQNLEPVRIVGNVPVLTTDWFVHAPAAFGYAKVDTTLEQEGDREIEPLRNPVSVLWDAMNRPGFIAGSVDFLPGGPADVSAIAKREAFTSMVRLAEGEKDVSGLQKGLLMANSSVELGDYDAAIAQYQNVLRTDPYNNAARRGMESAERKRLEYFKSAYDHQRSKMLAQVDESWEDKTPVQGSAVAFDYGIGRSPGAYLMEKMNRIILPKVELRGATIEQAIDYLRVKMREADTSGDASKGFSILLRTGNAPSNASISLDLKDVPMSEALRYVTELAQMRYKVEAHAVVVTPITENASEMYTRTYRVPPDFLVSGGADFDAAAAPADPFAAGGETPKSGAGLVARKTAKQILESQGITFPEGASASYNPATSQLVVRNTQPNLDLVEAFDSGMPKKKLSKSLTDGSPGLLPTIDEMRFKSGLIPLDVVLPETGRLLRFHGAQPPEALALHYTSWSQQMVRAVLAMGLGLALFWRFGRKRPWFMSLLVVVLAAWGAPLVFAGTWLALTNAVAFGWLCAGALWLLGWLFSFIRPHRQQFYISSRRAAA